MKRSIFIKIILMIFPIVILADLIILGSAYKITYDANYESCIRNVESASRIAADYFAMFDPDHIEDTAQCNEEFDKLCAMMDLTYLCAVKPDLEEKNIRYLSIGFGEGASEKAKKTRYPGVVIDVLHEEHILAMQGKDEGNIRKESNQFGDTIISYMPVTRYYDLDDLTFVYETKSVVAAEMSLSVVMDSFRTRFRYILIFTVVSSVIILGSVALIIYCMVTRPVRKISKRMASFVSDRKTGFKKLEVKGDDELSEMSRSFNTMADEIDSYIENISELNKERHTQEAELNIARRIQIGLLPPAEFRDRHVCVNASMLPAKDVGGDLYDYQVLADGRVCVAIADVSGKGVSAALFMARAITLIHQYASIGYSPSRILYEYNNSLAANNPNRMFITTFVGIYDPETREFTYSNGGHNCPYLLSDRLIALDSEGGMAAGIFAGEEYEEAVVSLKEGDVLFLYTDGVNEAESADGDFFGTQRLEEELSAHIGASGADVLTAVLERVADFAQDAVQSDDITVLAMRVLPQGMHKELELTAQAENLRTIFDTIRNIPSLSEEGKDSLCLMAEEMFVNICSYAYEGKTGDAKVIFDIADNNAELTFIDSGIPFDPTKDVLNIEDYDAEKRVGGLGRFLTFEVADAYSYTHQNGQNILKIVKKFSTGDE